MARAGEGESSLFWVSARVSSILYDAVLGRVGKSFHSLSLHSALLQWELPCWNADLAATSGSLPWLCCAAAAAALGFRSCWMGRGTKAQWGEMTPGPAVTQAIQRRRVSESERERDSPEIAFYSSFVTAYRLDTHNKWHFHACVGEHPPLWLSSVSGWALGVNGQ